MNDADFLTAFENATLTQFPHPDHIRMAWLYLRACGWTDGSMRIRDGIKHFAMAHGATRKYHETITLFWARLVEHAIAAEPGLVEFADFKTKFPILLDKGAILQHYSPALLQSESARQGWIEPDLIPMPH